MTIKNNYPDVKSENSTVYNLKSVAGGVEINHLWFDVNVHQKKSDKETEQAAQDIALAINQHDALVEQLNVLHKLICEGGVSGFNPREGDWAEKLFMSQNTTYHLLKENLREDMT